MKVRLLISRSGPGGTFNPGDEVEVSDAEAKRLFEAVPPKAVPVRNGAKPETTARQSQRKGRKG